jgi:hypothetical protein
VLDARQTLGTHGPSGQRVRIAFDMDRDTVLNRDLDAAAAVTAFAGGVYNFPIWIGFDRCCH